MMKYLYIMLAITVLAGCSQHEATTETQETKPPQQSRFHDLDLKPGMNREDVEKQVSTLLGQPQNYSPYGNNLRGGIVQYPDGDWILEVKYKAGASAPWVENPDGSMQHYPPMDETLIEYTIRKNP